MAILSRASVIAVLAGLGLLAVLLSAGWLQERGRLVMLQTETQWAEPSGGDAALEPTLATTGGMVAAAVPAQTKSVKRRTWRSSRTKNKPPPPDSHEVHSPTAIPQGKVPGFPNPYDLPKPPSFEKSRYALRKRLERDLKPWKARGITQFALAQTSKRYSHARAQIDPQAVIGPGVLSVAIINNVVFLRFNETSRRPLEPSVARRVRSVLQTLEWLAAEKPLPDVEFLLSLTGEPVLLADNVLDVEGQVAAHVTPVFSVLKYENDMDVLIPDAQFLDDRWRNGGDRSIKRLSDISWRKRKPDAVWEGLCPRDFSSAQPILDMLLHHASKELQSAQFVGRCPVQKWAAHKVVSKQLRPYLPVLRQTPAMPPSGGDAAAPESAAPSTEPRLRRTDAQLAQYLYHVHFAHSSDRALPRTLQYLLRLGSIVLQYQAADRTMEFFDDALEPWIHYVPFHPSNFTLTLWWLRRHPHFQTVLTQNVRTFLSTVLTESMSGWYWREALEAYAILQRFVPAMPEDACTCARDPSKTMALPFQNAVPSSAPLKVPRGPEVPNVKLVKNTLKVLDSLPRCINVCSSAPDTASAVDADEPDAAAEDARPLPDVAPAVAPPPEASPVPPTSASSQPSTPTPTGDASPSPEPPSTTPRATVTPSTATGGAQLVSAFAA